MCRIEENTKRTTKFHKWTCNLTPLIRNIMLKLLWKRGKIAPEEQFLPLSTIFYHLMLDFYVKTGIRFSLGDKRLFEITEVEMTRVDCSYTMVWSPVWEIPSLKVVDHLLVHVDNPWYNHYLMCIFGFRWHSGQVLRIKIKLRRLLI